MTIRAGGAMHPIKCQHYPDPPSEIGKWSVCPHSPHSPIPSFRSNILIRQGREKQKIKESLQAVPLAPISRDYFIVYPAGRGLVDLTLRTFDECSLATIDVDRFKRPEIWVA